ncbi:hypothetical protein [Nocardioides sp. LS1]|uniref:hypothetical protein n=1 Tax=Nocardioides sp. LS1 TaxID=1027620 RepID=UPI000F62049D|nr:hypothetical protein [Nocardioides sp. LS1]GCD91330.1 hypothetical protein NLS1_33360 [Nocardioides sp. LS1]
MTSTDVLLTLLRRWYLVVPGLVLSAVCAVLVMSRPGVYTTEVQVILVGPKGALAEGTSLVSPEESLIAMAGLVEREVNAGVPPEAATSEGVPLEGRGVRDGTLISLPNAGGQWNYNYVSPILSVQVVGPTPDDVVARRTSAVARIDRTLYDLQAADGIGPSRMISSRVVPQDPPVLLANGRPTRAAAGILLIGLVVVTSLTLLADRALLGRRSRRSRRVAVAATARNGRPVRS